MIDKLCNADGMKGEECGLVYVRTYMNGKKKNCAEKKSQNNPSK